MPLSLFEASLFQEAPENTATEPETPGPAPPDLPDVGDPTDAGDNPDDAPPDLPDMDFNDPGFGGADDQPADGETTAEPLEVGDKISMAMNYSLYQRFLTLSNTVSNQLETIKSSSDMILAVSPKALKVIEPLGKLGENIRLYLINTFLETNYSRNLFFYNKCLNLLQLLNDIFTKEMKAGKK